MNNKKNSVSITPPLLNQRKSFCFWSNWKKIYSKHFPSEVTSCALLSDNKLISCGKSLVVLKQSHHQANLWFLHKNRNVLQKKALYTWSEINDKPKEQYQVGGLGNKSQQSAYRVFLTDLETCEWALSS